MFDGTQRMNFRLVKLCWNSLTLEAVKVRFGNGDVVTIGSSYGSHSFLLGSLSPPPKRPQDPFHSHSGSKVFTEF